MNKNATEFPVVLTNGQNFESNPIFPVDDRDNLASSGYDDFGVNDDGTARNGARTRTKCLIRCVRKKTVRAIRNALTCFKLHDYTRGHERTKGSRQAREFAGEHSAVRGTTTPQQQSVGEVARQLQPSDTIIPRQVSSVATDDKSARDTATQSHHEQHVSTTGTVFSLLPSTSDDKPTVFSSYSFYKDDLPRCLKSSPPVEKPVININTGTVASLRKILSEHHVLKSYANESSDDSNSASGMMSQGCGSNSELGQEGSRNSQDGDGTDISEEVACEQPLNREDNSPFAHYAQLERVEDSLLQTPIGESWSENSSHVSVTRNSSTQVSSIVSDKSVTQRMPTIWEDVRPMVRSTGEENGECSHPDAGKASSDSDIGEQTQFVNVGIIAEGIEDFKKGAASRARWLYQALCSLCSYESEDIGKLIIV